MIFNKLFSIAPSNDEYTSFCISFSYKFISSKNFETLLIPKSNPIFKVIRLFEFSKALLNVISP